MFKLTWRSGENWEAMIRIMYISLAKGQEYYHLTTHVPLRLRKMDKFTARSKIFNNIFNCSMKNVKLRIYISSSKWSVICYQST